MLVIGHRGAAGLARENSISSLQKAEEFRVDMVEVDLRKTKDGQIVLMHDPSLLRTHDDPRKVSELTLEQIHAIGITEHNSIPTLDEFLAEANVDINLELKESGMEKEVLSKIKNFSHKVLISSHHPSVIKKIKALDENIPVGFVIGPKMGQFFPLMVGLASYLKPYSIHPYHTLITPSHMKMMRGITKRIYPWTINTVHEYQIIKGFGIDGMFTDYPDLFK
jgi:glycerophosphoryl diester phosphodiesterase